MTDRSAQKNNKEGMLISLQQVRQLHETQLVTFHRHELDEILRLYSFMVAAGEWRDYAIDHLHERAIFSVFRRTSETPLFQILKTPSLARKQGAYSVVSANGLPLKRGHNLTHVLGIFNKTLKLVRS